MIARALHFNSIRKDRPVHRRECAALNEEPGLEAELSPILSASRPAGEGSAGSRLSDNGPCFLDEVEAMSREPPGKAPQGAPGRTFYPVGSARTDTVNVRIIAPPI